MLSDAILIFLITSVSAVCAAMLKLLYDSKCKKCSMCWNCMTIDRDTQAEVDIQEHIVTHAGGITTNQQVPINRV